MPWNDEHIVKYKPEIPKGFYVYMLCYPNGLPFYVGKGTGYRAWNHLNCQKEKSKNQLKSNIIDKIHRNEGRVRVEVVVSEISEQSAFDTEKFLIQSYGTRFDNTGILSNFSKGGEGPSGAIVSAETRSKISDAVNKRNSDPNFNTAVYASYGRLGKEQSLESLAKANLTKADILHTEDNIQKEVEIILEKRVAKKAKPRKSRIKNNLPILQISLQSEESISVWKDADKYYSIWVEDKSLGCRRLAKSLNSSYLNAHESLLKYFRAGWVPTEDAKWQEVYHSVVEE